MLLDSKAYIDQIVAFSDVSLRVSILAEFEVVN